MLEMLGYFKAFLMLKPELSTVNKTNVVLALIISFQLNLGDKLLA
jgi:hypothetical protein